MIRLIVVIGRRWRDKLNGNTYHSVHVVVQGIQDGESFVTQKHVGMTYGYDEAYVQTAAKVLTEAGYTTPETNKDGSSTPLWSYCADHNITLVRNVVDVARKKDL